MSSLVTRNLIRTRLTVLLLLHQPTAERGFNVWISLNESFFIGYLKNSDWFRFGPMVLVLFRITWNSWHLIPSKYYRFWLRTFHLSWLLKNITLWNFWSCVSKTKYQKLFLDLIFSSLNTLWLASDFFKSVVSLRKIVWRGIIYLIPTDKILLCIGRVKSFVHTYRVNITNIK